ncbi:MAG: HtaA domain-containing protein [Solirubrobacteraceae bacterium]|nr:HtaA domain-containing protein [Solirubrobacteraceae bacterium]
MLRSTRSVLITSATVAALGAIPALAGAAPATVYGGATAWTTANVYDLASPSTTNRTWLGYVTSAFGAPAGNSTIADGATLSGPTGAPVSIIDGTTLKSLDAYTYGYNVAAGTVDPEAGTLDVTTTGTVKFETHGETVALSNAHVVVNAGGTGSISFGGGKTTAGVTTAYDAATPLFTVTGATFRRLSPSVIEVTGLAPTVAKTEVFGVAYPAGVAGPNRTPNVFGEFRLTLDTSTPTPKVVEVPVEKVVEKTVTVTQPVDVPAVRTVRTLSARPFATSATVDVTIRKSGSTTVLGEGYVAGKKLVVFLAKGTKLDGKYVLSRQSGSKQLAKTKTVSFGAAKQGAKKASK